ncbi:Kelch repeat type 1 [Arabidopsis suecica]|uniref:Kelch repeat type 1 n=1 Tax=Arabidopsis suecica TaxID=45249 RepID=A0A8T1YI81_ARASU|nr:Kelch repeat type 1 [Arabidopsis suecica]
MIPEEEVEPPQKKTKLPPLQCELSFLSLPNEIIVNCFARISKSSYRSLSLVCKTFRSLISSPDLYAARSQLGTTEICGLYLCLRFSTVPFKEPTRRWFTLSVQPNRNLTDAIWIYDCRTRTWGDVPNMKMKRKDASACVLDDKIYVMGGCDSGGINWFEMFDIKTQSWRTLPEIPDVKVRMGGNVRKINVVRGKIYVKTEAEVKDWIYDVKEGKWSVAEEYLSLLWSNSWCVIENVMYCYSCSRYKWYDLEARMWKDVKGLERLNRYRSASNDFRNCLVELVNYGGKLAILWDKFERPGRSQNKHIWCAMVALNRGFGDTIWGKIEWVNVVLTVPKSYNFLRCIALSV